VDIFFAKLESLKQQQRKKRKKLRSLSTYVDTRYHFQHQSLRSSGLVYIQILLHFVINTWFVGSVDIFFAKLENLQTGKCLPRQNQLHSLKQQQRKKRKKLRSLSTYVDTRYHFQRERSFFLFFLCCCFRLCSWF
jgi:hypothetical protein